MWTVDRWPRSVIGTECVDLKCVDLKKATTAPSGNYEPYSDV